MFLLDILPSWIFYSFFIIGIVLFAVSQFAAQIPFISKYGNAATLIALVMIILGIFFIGAEFNQSKWEKREAVLEQKIASFESAQPIINEVVVTQFIDRPIEVIKKETTELIKKVPVIITKEIDTSCKITEDIIRLHNDAASSTEILF